MASTYSERRFRGRDELELYYRDYAAGAAAGATAGAGAGAGGGALALLCMHGLTRNSRDFEGVAPEWARTRRVLVPDVRGRAHSAYDPKPERYTPATYALDMLELLDDAGEERAIAIGTSMGGLMAMVLAALAPQRLAGIVLNDVGPVIDPRGLARIAGYVGKTPDMRNWDEAAAALREQNAAIFPDWDESDWRVMARRGFREETDGRVVPDYDAAIAGATSSAVPAAADAWPLFDGLRDVPTLVVRGANSDILAADTLTEMERRKPDLQVAIVPDRGHAPTLEEPVCRERIATFLETLP